MQAKINGAYSRGHDTPAKTTNHAKHSCVCNKYEIVEKGHENSAKKKIEICKPLVHVYGKICLFYSDSLLFQTTPAEIKKMIKVA